MKDKKIQLPQKFCYSQCVCSDNSRVYSCQANLAEGRVLICHYDQSDISVENYPGNNKEIHYRFQIRRQTLSGDGICQDFKIIPKVGKQILEEIAEQILPKENSIETISFQKR